MFVAMLAIVLTPPLAAGTVQVKDLGSGETVQAKGAGEVAAAVKRVLSVNPAPNGAAEVSPGR